MEVWEEACGKTHSVCVRQNFIIKTPCTVSYAAVGTQNRNEPSSVASSQSAETQSILMSLHGQPDRFIWKAECSLVGAKSDEQLCRGH